MIRFRNISPSAFVQCLIEFLGSSMAKKSWADQTTDEVLRLWQRTAEVSELATTRAEQMIDLVEIFASQIDGILVLLVRGNAFQLQIVWNLFRTARELSYIRIHLESFLESSKCCWDGISEVKNAKLLVPLKLHRIKGIEATAKIKLTSNSVVVLKCDFHIVKRIVDDANALYCRRWLSENGLHELLAVYTPDDEICILWSGYIRKSTCPDKRYWHAARIVRMMRALCVQHYCHFTYQ